MAVCAVVIIAVGTVLLVKNSKKFTVSFVTGASPDVTFRKDDTGRHYVIMPDSDLTLSGKTD